MYLLCISIVAGFLGITKQETRAKGALLGHGTATGLFVSTSEAKYSERGRSRPRPRPRPRPRHR